MGGPGGGAPVAGGGATGAAPPPPVGPDAVGPWVGGGAGCVSDIGDTGAWDTGALPMGDVGCAG